MKKAVISRVGTDFVIKIFEDGALRNTLEVNVIIAAVNDKFCGKKLTPIDLILQERGLTLYQEKQIEVLRKE